MAFSDFVYFFVCLRQVFLASFDVSYLDRLYACMHVCLCTGRRCRLYVLCWGRWDQNCQTTVGRYIPVINSLNYSSYKLTLGLTIVSCIYLFISDLWLNTIPPLLVWFVVDLFYNKLYNKSTTDQASGVWACGSVDGSSSQTVSNSGMINEKLKVNECFRKKKKTLNVSW